MAKVLGIIWSASENSAIASCSLEPKVLAKSSRYTERATSTAPPPATILFDSNTLLTTQRES
jgi:hypothetical protein